jgi:hypothetical protein
MKRNQASKSYLKRICLHEEEDPGLDNHSLIIELLGDITYESSKSESTKLRQALAVAKWEAFCTGLK